MEYYNSSLHRLPGMNLSVTDNPQSQINPDYIGYWGLVLKEYLYNWVTLLNFFLAVFIIIHNSIIIRFYYLHRTDITQLLFMLIGIADIFAAVGMNILVISSVLFYNDLIGPLQFQRGIIIYLLLYPAALACSRSLNVFMTVVKTISIASIAWRGTPVQIHNTAVIVLSFFTFLLWLAMNTYDVISYWHMRWEHPVHVPGDSTDYSVDDYIMAYLASSVAVGMRATRELTRLCDHFCVHIFYLSFYTIHFILPSFITFVCMLIQGCSIKSTLAPSEESNSSGPSASYVNTTIFMITALFCFCHTSYCFCIFIGNQKLSHILSVGSLLEFSLPLLNAALFPLIIILRKQSLRERYRDFFLRVCATIRSGVGVVVRKCGGVVRWVGGIGRRADYEELSGVEES